MSYISVNPSEHLILIVDDTETNVRLLSHVLRQAGFNIIVAFNGADAMELATKRTPDLILLDIMMPEMDGFEVCARLKADEPLSEIPVIFLSALSDTTDKIEGFNAGGVDYITKPFQKDEVLARIQTHLYLRKLQRERNERIQILIEREIELSLLNKRKDDLVRMVSHDMKNPIMGIIGLIDILKEDELVDEKEKGSILDVMRSSGEKLLEMVKNVLDKESNSNKVHELNKKNFDLIAIAKKVLELNQAKAVLKKIELVLKSEEEECIAFVDPDKIEIVLNNLVSNALKFTTPKGTVTIEIGYGEDKKNALIKVTDTGIGIPENMIDRLFRANSKVSTIGTAGEMGTGLGLDIVQLYSELHQGKVWVKSKENVGSTFYVQLPLFVN